LLERVARKKEEGKRFKTLDNPAIGGFGPNDLIHYLDFFLLFISYISNFSHFLPFLISTSLYRDVYFLPIMYLFVQARKRVIESMH